MHSTQKILLKRLLDQNNQRYSALTRQYSYDDNVVFHLKQLVNKGFIHKADGRYSITARGVKEITKYDLTKLSAEGFKTFFVGFLCSYKYTFLIKGHPQGQVNFYNLPSTKPLFGKPIETSLIKGLKKYINLLVDAKDIRFQSLHLKTIMTSSGEVLFDDAFAIYGIELTKDQYVKTQTQDNVTWMTVAQIKELNNRWPEIDMCILQKNNSIYHTYTYISDYIL